MTSHSQFVRWALIARTLLITGLVSTLLGCAPGTGGTGTGPVTSARPVAPAEPVPPTGPTTTTTTTTATVNVLSSDALFATTGSNINLTASSVEGVLVMGLVGAGSPLVSAVTTSGNPIFLLPFCPTPSSSEVSTTTTITQVTPTFTNTGNSTATASLSLLSQGIRYQQDCYVFTYQGSWVFDSSLSLTVQGSVTNTLSPANGAINMSLKLRTSGSLSEPEVSVNAMLLNPDGTQAWPATVLQPIKR